MRQRTQTGAARHRRRLAIFLITIKPFSIYFGVLFCALAASGQVRPTLPPGQVTEAVQCAAEPDETYSLYLPSGYTPARPWPIIYAFDPGARGKTPVKLLQAAAEKYGYIVVGSNNSRNFAIAEASRAANAMWQDTHARFPIDERQTYTTGFSGGARVAGLVALRCAPCKIAGVIAQGAGYPNTEKPPQPDRLLYYLSVGDQDFNWPEIVAVRREREQSGSPYRFRTFAGEHQWAPASVMEDAVEWIYLKAIQAGSQARDEAFLDRALQRMQAEAVDAEQRGDAIAQLSALRSLASDFRGLREVKEYEAKLAKLKPSSALDKALKKEQEAMASQEAIVRPIAAQLANLGDADDSQRRVLQLNIATGMRQLKAQGEHSKDADKRLVMLRAVNDLWAQGIEAGQSRLERKEFETAALYFGLMEDIAPSEPWPSLLLAETRVAEGNKKQALKDLREAVKRGLKNPEVLERDPDLQPLRADPEFQKIVEGMKKE